ncbi:MAG: cupin domain-containing protein [bacterium]
MDKQCFVLNYEQKIKNIPENYLRLLESGNQSHCLHSGLVCLNPGENVGEHSTKQYEEMLVVLAGQGKAEVYPDQIFDIKSGCIVYIPPDKSHNVYNTGDDELKYIYIVTKTR